ncbi:tellurite resistance TerB family protein [Pseudorhodobacter turbinis]|uniref:Tellurite resistance TerB family protein n=1 Tax=Pseudorhodobacter turbinis TaxID=2500533 RepID=A0A4P8ED79_9RHOB|nr:DUF533 domain-containing protein [Pseudorhodobacter turbinis]QCO54633.1 tellurite resistance TerB family protein [Pseudorhodobacter turbinis]
MSLFSTLAKVAVGVVIAKGVSHVSRNGMPKLGSGGIGGMLESLGGASRANADARGPHTSGLGGLLAQAGPALSGLLGGQASQSADTGLNPAFNPAILGQAGAAPSRDQELAAALLLRAMVQAAMADGKLDDAERAKLMEHLEEASQAERAYVTSLFEQQPDIDGLTADVPHGMEEQVYLVSLMAIDLDSQAEAQYLHGLAQGLGLDQPVVNDIHRQAGVPPLYA